MWQFKPVVKWAGGKSRLINQLAKHIPSTFQDYHEPFLGGGAMFFYLAPRLLAQGSKAFLSDMVEELIILYQVIQSDVDRLISVAKKHKYEEEYYYSIRSLDPTEMADPVERAARMLYLNKTCFNGLYRVNKKGQFNVSFGSYNNPVIVNEDDLRSAARALRCATIFNDDFESVLKNAKAGDFVYLDPPYVPLSATSDFTQYTADSFGVEDHVRLKKTFDLLKERGCFVMLSNSNSTFVKDLYREYNIKTVSAARAINSNAKRRGKIKELIILSYSDSELRSIKHADNEVTGGVGYAGES